MRVEYEKLRKLGYKTLKELNEDLKNNRIEFIGIDDIERAHELERAMLPKNIRYAKEGDIYKAKKDVAIEYLTMWAAPFTGGGENRIPKGTNIQVISVSDEKAIAPSCKPVQYEEIEKLIIPEKDRKSFKYGGYYLVIEILKLNEEFEFIRNEEILDNLSFWERFIKKIKKAWL